MTASSAAASSRTPRRTSRIRRRWRPKWPSVWKDLRALGETEQRSCSLDAWRECPYYTDRERAALAWTEAVTRIADGRAPDEVYEQVRPHFTDTELADLTLAIATINAWNRLSIAARLVRGTYQPAMAQPA